VPIVLNANGTENALSFSLNFNPALLSYSGVMVGNDDTNAMILPNVSRVSSGRLGIELALPSGQTFAAGKSEIARVFFTSQGLGGIEPVVTPISFTSQPIAELVSDVNGNSLSNKFVNGSVALSLTGFEVDVAAAPSGVMLRQPLFQIFSVPSVGFFGGVYTLEDVGVVHARFCNRDV